MVRQKHWISMLSCSVIVIAFLSIQWLLVDFTFAFETPAFVAHPAPNPFGVTDSGVETITPHVTPFSFLVVSVLPLMFAIVLPTIRSITARKRAMIPTRGKTKDNEHSFTRRNRPTNLFVATPRQLCASPDAHGP